MTTIDCYCVVGSDREYDLNAEDLLHDMDGAGVERAVIAPPDRFLAVDNREGNERMLAASRAHPSRLIPTCSANPWFGAAAVKEVSRAFDAGAKLLVLHPFVQGFLANDELVFPLLEVAEERRAPIYIHTGAPGNSTPWQVVDCALRYPKTPFIMGHCGATDFWYDVVDAARAAPNVHLEASLARPFNFARYAAEVGAGRCLMGSFAPLNPLVFEWHEMRAVLPPDDYGPIYGENLLRLLDKGATAGSSFTVAAEG